MRGNALLIMGGALLLFVAGLGIRAIFQAIATYIEDRTTRKDCEELARLSDDRREEKRHQDMERLNNSCEHIWGAMISAFPVHACRLCGLEKERPPGDCDHVWRVEMASAPFGYCEKCNQRYVKPSTY